MTNSNKLHRFKFKKYVPSDEGVVNSSRWNTLINKRYFRLVLGLVAGAFLGYLYWKFVGCQSGTCPLTSNPYKSVILFSFMGALMARDKSAGRVEAK